MVFVDRVLYVEHDSAQTACVRLLLEHCPTLLLDGHSRLVTRFALFPVRLQGWVER